MNLEQFFKANPKVALGFSGGVDSSYLLYAAKRWGADVCAYYIKSQFQPVFELNDAKRLAEQIKTEIKIIECDVLADQCIAANPSDRCYYCKNRIFSVLRQAALADGYSVIIDGTNASDDAGDRPGMKSLKEMEVLSPLRQCGITKGEVRRLSKEAGLFTWDKPAYACLATRVSVGEPITPSVLERVEKSENVLFDLGFTDFRVRVSKDGAARLQLTSEQMQKAIEARGQIRKALEPYFTTVLLDLEDR